MIIFLSHVHDTPFTDGMVALLWPFVLNKHAELVFTDSRGEVRSETALFVFQPITFLHTRQ